jgi:hypothetical protein
LHLILPLLLQKDHYQRIRRNLAASGNSTDAWFGGGYTTVNVSTVDRIIFASDTATAVAKGPLSLDKKKFSSIR